MLQQHSHKSQITSISLTVLSFNTFCSYQDSCRLLSPPSQELEAVFICMAAISNYINCSTYVIIILVCISF